MKTFLPVYILISLFSVLAFWKIHTQPTTNITADLPKIHKELESLVTCERSFQTTLRLAFQEKTIAYENENSEEAKYYYSNVANASDKIDLIHDRTEQILEYITRLEATYTELHEENNTSASPFLAEKEFAKGMRKALKDTLQNYYSWMQNITNIDRPDSLKYHFEYLNPKQSEIWEQERFNGSFIENKISFTMNKLDIIDCENRFLNNILSNFSYLQLNTYLEFQDEATKLDYLPQHKRKNW